MRARPIPGRIVRPILACALLAGCTVSRDYSAPDLASLDVAGDYAAPKPAQMVSGEASVTDWWTRFDDPAIPRLVGLSVAGNLDLSVAAARLAQAREALVQARTGRLPTVTASGGLTRSGFVTGAPSASVPILTPGTGTGTPGVGTPGTGGALPGIGVQTVTASGQTALSLGGDASYTVDLFGAIGRSIEAANADVAASALDAEAVRVSVVSETVRNYVVGRVAQERLAIARDSLGIADENLEIAGWRVLAGLVSATDQEQARTQRAQRLATIPPLAAQIAQAANRLGVLTGRAPSALTGVFAEPAPIPTPPTAIAVGVPADTLRQRPDVAAAERRLASASARAGVARAQLYPALRITGNLNNQSTGLGSLLDRVTYGLFGGLTQTLFDGGRLRSQVRAQEAATVVAFADYRRTILSSLEDVENALLALDSAELRVAAQAEALDAAQATAIYARSNYRAGLIDFTTLLTVENNLLSARDGLALARGDRALAAVQLYNALGGGFGTAAPGAGGFGTVPGTGAGGFGTMPGTGPATAPARQDSPTP